MAIIHYEVAMRFRTKLKLGMSAFVLGALTLFGVSRGSKPDDLEPENQNINKPTVKKPRYRVTYTTDTIEQRSSILLYNQNGKIHRFYRDNDSMYRLKLFLFVHEAWHTHNNNLGFRKHKFSLRQYQKLLIHDEISACLAALNSLILEYSFSDDKETFLKNITKPNRFFSFYFKKVASGDIVPFSNDSNMIKKDLSLRVNGAIKTWMSKSYDSYSKRQKKMVLNYIQLNGLFNDNQKTYQKMVQGMYKIGGIDFWKYVKEDVQVSDLSLLAGLPKVASFSKKNSTAINEIKKFMPLLENIYDDKQRALAVQHLIISSEIKAKIIDKKYKVNEQTATILYNKSRLAHEGDNSFSEFVEENTILSKKLFFSGEKKAMDLNQFIKEIYNLNGFDLTEVIKNFDTNDVPYIAEKSFFAQSASGKNTFVWNSYDEAFFEHEPHSDKAQIVAFQGPRTKIKLRQSAPQYVDIPNFWEPILIAATPQQTEDLKNLYRDFNNQPEVQLALLQHRSKPKARKKQKLR